MSKENARKFTYLSAEINSLYHEAAVNIGISDTVFDILYVLCEKGNQCLQSEVFKLTGISRQTINSAVRKLEKDEMAYLKQGMGRNTVICLTEKGKLFVQKYMYPIFEMENNIWNEWTVEEQEQYLMLTKRYRDTLKEYVLNVR